MAPQVKKVGWLCLVEDIGCFLLVKKVGCLLHKDLMFMVKSWMKRGVGRNTPQCLCWSLCCGGISYKDWSQNMYFNCTATNPSRERCSVPFSCCLRDTQEAVINTMCGQGMQAMSYLEASAFIYTNGCIDTLVNWIHSNLFLLGGIALGLAVPQVPGVSPPLGTGWGGGGRRRDLPAAPPRLGVALTMHILIATPRESRGRVWGGVGAVEMLGTSSPGSCVNCS
uniref:Tetraspanin-33 n=1 Tax=Calidris pygmaea TaxID=425635 RepID=A0A8C3KNY0_9CHAR